MQTKQPLTVLGTLIFLLGVFGYIFPIWHATRFTNNENLLHVVIAVLLWLAAAWDAKKRVGSLLVAALLFLALGVYGFTLKDPNYFVNSRLFIRFDAVDNYIHAIGALIFTWFWLQNRHRKNT